MKLSWLVFAWVALTLTSCAETNQKSTQADLSKHTPLLTMPDVPTFKSVKPGTPEELLAAEGKWNLVEEGDVYDPAQAHLAARSKVNPKQMKKRADLIAHFEPDSKSSKDGKFRVLRMEPQGADWREDLEISGGYEVAETSIAKPTQKVVGTELVEKIRTAFAQQQAQEKTSPDQGMEEIVAAEVASNTPIPVSKPILAARVVPVPSAKKPPAYEIAQVEPEFTLKSSVKPSEKFVAKAKPPEVASEKRPGLLGTLKKSFSLKPANTASAKDQPSYPAVQLEQPSPKVKYQIISSGKEAASGADLKGFRSAIHDGRTRIAMDLSTSVKYKVAIDHIRNVLRVKLEKTRWLEPPTGTMRASGLLGTYVTNPQADGSIILEIRLKKKAKISDTMILRPDQTAHHRIVIDLES